MLSGKAPIAEIRRDGPAAPMIVLFTEGSVFLGVVDPGVGGAIVVEAEPR